MEEGLLLLVLKVELGNGSTGAIEVREGASIRQLALQFCATHNLDAQAVADPLVAHIAKNVREITQGRDERQRDRWAGERSLSPPPDSAGPSSSSPASPASGRRRMDSKIAEALRRDLQRERERRMKELQAEARMQGNGSDRSGEHARQPPRPSRAFGADPPKSTSGAQQPPEAAHDIDAKRMDPRQRAYPPSSADEGRHTAHRPSSARGHGLELTQYRQWMNEHCSVAAGERMYSEAMKKIAERRQSVRLCICS
jgi:hypothetical protein